MGLVAWEGLRVYVAYCVCVVTDLDLECLATWKDGSESYLYSRLTSTSSPAAAASDDDGNQYRCLVGLYCRSLYPTVDSPRGTAPTDCVSPHHVIIEAPL